MVFRPDLFIMELELWIYCGISVTAIATSNCPYLFQLPGLKFILFVLTTALSQKYIRTSPDGSNYCISYLLLLFASKAI